MDSKIRMIVVIAIVAAVAFYFGQNRSADVDASKSIAPLPAASVLQIKPSTTKSAPVRAPNGSGLSIDMQQFAERKDWASLYAKVKSGAQNGESLYLQAEILDRCAKRTATEPDKPQQDTREVKREKFIKSLTGKPEAIAARIAAYDELTFDYCGSLKDLVAPAAEIDRLRRAAAEAGDPRAKAWQLALDIREKSPTKLAETDATLSGLNVTDENWRQMQQLLASKDPFVINDLRNMMASTWRDAAVLLGPNGEAIDQPAFRAALGLLTCEYGANCGPSHPAITNACAFQGRCGAGTLQDQTYFFESSPHQAQLIDYYRQELARMIASGDFSGIRVSRGQQSRGNMYFWGGR